MAIINWGIDPYKTHKPLGVKPMLTYQVEVIETDDPSQPIETWRLNGKKHREGDLPAVTEDGSKFWYKHGLRHRTQGPAIEYSLGRKEWFLDGENMTEAEHAFAMNPTTDMTIAEIEKKLGYKIKVIK